MFSGSASVVLEGDAPIQNHPDSPVKLKTGVHEGQIAVE